MEGLYQFSAPEPACFVSVTRDNRIKIWDVVSYVCRGFDEGNGLPTCIKSNSDRCLWWHVTMVFISRRTGYQQLDCGAH
jgi:hypothetical protein